MHSYIPVLLAVAVAASGDIKSRQEAYVDFSCPGVAGAVTQFGVCCDLFTDLTSTALTGVGANCAMANTTTPGYYTCVGASGSSRGCCKLRVANTTNYAGCSPALPYGQQGTLTGGSFFRA